MTAEEKRGLQCYRRYIERSLNPVYVLGNMADWLPDGEPTPPTHASPGPSAPGPRPRGPGVSPGGGTEPPIVRATP